jgi:hypothetical protein
MNSNHRIYHHRCRTIRNRCIGLLSENPNLSSFLRHGQKEVMELGVCLNILFDSDIFYFGYSFKNLGRPKSFADGPSILKYIMKPLMNTR